MQGRTSPYVSVLFPPPKCPKILHKFNFFNLKHFFSFSWEVILVQNFKDQTCKDKDKDASHKQVHKQVTYASHLHG